MPRYFINPAVLLLVMLATWGFGYRNIAEAADAEPSHEVGREPAAGYAEHTVDNSGGRNLAVLDSKQVEIAIEAELDQLGVKRQRLRGENKACADENDTECLMSLSRPERVLPK